jgi:hypothetical protein
MTLQMPVDLTRRLKAAIVEKLNPNTESDTRQIWDLWYLPGAYCYLITSVDKILPQTLIQEFRRERDLRVDNLGLPPFAVKCSEQIHVYVNGCFQNIHNDSTRPGYSYVYYLQDDVQFTGGQTFLYTKDFPDPSKPAAGTSFYEQVDPIYSQMLLFNNNIPHLVPVMQGTMNPNRGRITLCSRMLY